jgi:hypothetical protein
LRRNDPITEIDQSYKNPVLNESSDVSLKGHLQMKNHQKHNELKHTPTYRRIFTHLESKNTIDPHEEAKQEQQLRALRHKFAMIKKHRDSIRESTVTLSTEIENSK